MADTLLIFAAIVLSLPYVYVTTRICAMAYFEEKIEYQKKFFKKFDIPHNSGTH